MLNVKDIVKRIPINETIHLGLRGGDAYIELEIFRNGIDEYYVDILHCDDEELKVYEGYIMYYNLNEFVREFGDFEIVFIEHI